MATRASRLLTRNLPLNLAFALTGAATVLLGPLLPHLSADLTLPDAAAGRLFLAQFLASTAGALLLDRIGARLSLARTLALAYLGVGAGVAALGHAGREAAYVCVAAYGFALGLINPAANRMAGADAAALNLLNMHWSLGAVLAPPVFSWVFATAGVSAALPPFGLLALLCAVAVLRLPQAPGGAPRIRPAPALEHRTSAWPAALSLFLYVGAETSLSGWLPAFSVRLAAVPLQYGGLPLAVFWASILGGRLLAGLRLGAIAPERLARRASLLALTGFALLLQARRPEVLLAGAILAGAGMAPLFPCVVARFQRRAGAASPALIGRVFACGGLGGVVFPWLAGSISTAAGSLPYGLLAAAAAMAALALTLFIDRD